MVTRSRSTKRRSTKRRSTKRKSTKSRSTRRSSSRRRSSRTLSKLKRYGSKARSMAMRNKYKLLGGAAGLAGTYAAHRFMKKPLLGYGNTTGYTLVKGGLSDGFGKLKGKVYSTKDRMASLLNRLRGNKTN